jgi:predicted LPLAT superfamily acyltransferase
VSVGWAAQAERGSPALMRLMVRLVIALGRRTGRVLLGPIALYFAVFSSRASAASRQYLHQVFGRRPRFSEVLRHYYTFSTTIMDRVFFLTDRTDRLQITVRGEQNLEALTAQNKGCLLLGSHLGSFEALRSLGANQKRVPVKALYYAHNSQMLDQVFERLNPGLADQIIPLGTPAAMIEANEFIAKGGFVGVLGDRWLEDGGSIEVDFLGKPAPFPTWPMRLIGVMQVPVYLFFALHKGGRKYEIIFEPFVTGPVNTRSDDVLRDLVERYAARVEHHCRTAPYNWFNFYDFWNAA